MSCIMCVLLFDVEQEYKIILMHVLLLKSKYICFLCGCMAGILVAA